MSDGRLDFATAAEENLDGVFRYLVHMVGDRHLAGRQPADLGRDPVVDCRPDAVADAIDRHVADTRLDDLGQEQPAKRAGQRQPDQQRDHAATRAPPAAGRRVHAPRRSVVACVESDGWCCWSRWSSPS